MQAFKSLIYWIYVICVLLFFFTQMGSPGFDAKKPAETEDGVYGTKISKDEKDIFVFYFLWFPLFFWG